MQRKLLSWIPLPLQTLTLTQPPIRPHSFPPPSTFLLSFSTKPYPSSSDAEPYDPPFSPIPKPKPPPKTLAPSKGEEPQSQSLLFQSDLPFDFRYSYSETDPSVKPIGFREPPRFSPFGPGRLDRKWDGVSAPAPERGEVASERVLEERKSVLGDPLTEEEVEELVDKYRHSDCTRQINLGFSALCSSSV